MATLTIAVPLPPGNADQVRAGFREVLESRRDEQDASRRRVGVTRERCWVQPTPMGEFFLLMLEGTDPVRSNREFAASTDPYDVWFKDVFGAALGQDFSQPIPVNPECKYRTTDGSAAQQVAFVTPILPGQLDAWLRMVDEVNGPRRADHDDFHRRVGVLEDWYLQPNPDGSYAKIIYLESNDLGGAIMGLAGSQHPHDLWFKRSLLAVDGIDWGQPPAGPLPELVFDWSSRAGVGAA